MQGKGITTRERYHEGEEGQDTREGHHAREGYHKGGEGQDKMDGHHTREEYHTKEGRGKIKWTGITQGKSTTQRRGGAR